jgi:predicted site-specific integrase-resolvase
MKGFEVPTQPNDHFVPRAIAMRELGVSATTIWRYERSGRLRPTRLSRKKVGYLRSEIARFLGDATVGRTA